MYGIANSCIPEMITHSYGSKRWNDIKQRHGISDESLIGSSAYNDELTYRMATVLAREFNDGIPEVFNRLGKWWVLNTTSKTYASLVKAGGHSLQQFMFNLPLFNQAFMNGHPGLCKTTVQVTHITSNGMQLHYCSSRAGLKDFLFGMLQGLGKMYNCNVKVKSEHVPGSSQQICKVEFNPLSVV
jgi:hypothetical protein